VNLRYNYNKDEFLQDKQLTALMKSVIVFSRVIDEVIAQVGKSKSLGDYSFGERQVFCGALNESIDITDDVMHSTAIDC
jgi:hypothetical protein